jgi:hypothetical protein
MVLIKSILRELLMQEAYEIVLMTKLQQNRLKSFRSEIVEIEAKLIKISFIRNFFERFFCRLKAFSCIHMEAHFLSDSSWYWHS